MKRKYFYSILILIIVCVLSVGLVACNHKHKWSTEWQMDSTHHWHTCDKKNCDEISDKEEHNFEYQCEGDNHWQVCSTCGYVTEKTAHNMEMKYNDTKCWYACNECGIKKDEKEHDFTPLDPFCRRCGFKKGTEGLIYTLNSDGKSYTLTGANIEVEPESSRANTISDIVVSEYYNGLPVVAIGDNAFAFYNITSIYFPKSITTIGTRAFRGCKMLSEVTIPLNITTIKYGAFEDCNGITIKVRAKKEEASSGWSMDSWGINQFYKYPIIWDCDNNKIADDGYEYFIDKETNIKFGVKEESVAGNYDGTAIIAKQSQLLYALNLYQGNIEYKGKNYKITSVADCALYDNEVVTSIRLPNNVTKIGDYAFSRCTNLDTIYWETGVSPEGYGVEVIGIGAFMDCGNLTEFTLPNKVTTISAGLLQNCVRLTKIVIHKDVKSINKNAFNGCSLLGTIAFGGTQTAWNNIEKQEGWDKNTGSYIVQYNT